MKQPLRTKTKHTGEWKALLDGKFHPVTYCFGFMEAPFETLKQGFAEWYKEITGKIKVPLNTLEPKGNLPHLLKALEPLTIPPHRYLLIPTQSRWVAFFANTAMFPDAASPISYMCSRVKCRGVVLSCIPDTKMTAKESKGTYGSVGFQMFGPNSSISVRSVFAANDGGKWVFINQGEVQPFEETIAYKEKLVRNRITPEMLERYCEALGIRVFDQRFYRNNGFLVEWGKAKTAVVRSYKEAQDYYGLIP